MTVCSRCGVVNRPGRVACIQCLFRLDPAADAGPLMCADHPQAPATGRCVTCQKLVCDTCGGVINNRAVWNSSAPRGRRSGGVFYALLEAGGQKRLLRLPPRP